MGSRVMVLGSKEADVQRILDSRDLPGMAGFDHELKVLAARRRRGETSAIQLPAGTAALKNEPNENRWLKI